MTTSIADEKLPELEALLAQGWYVPGESYPLISVAADEWIKKVQQLGASLLARIRSDQQERARLVAYDAWVDRADRIDDDAAYLNGEHPEQRASGRNGWDDIRDIRRGDHQ